MAATPGHKITLTCTDGTNTTTVGKILSVQYDGAEVTTIDSTVFGDSWRTAIAGLKDPRSARVRVQYDKAEHAKLVALLGLERTWTFDSGDATASASNIDVAGFVSAGPSFTGEINGQIEGEFTIQMSSGPTHSTN